MHWHFSQGFNFRCGLAEMNALGEMTWHFSQGIQFRYGLTEINAWVKLTHESQEPRKPWERRLVMKTTATLLSTVY